MRSPRARLPVPPMRRLAVIVAVVAGTVSTVAAITPDETRDAALARPDPALVAAAQHAASVRTFLTELARARRLVDTVDLVLAARTLEQLKRSAPTPTRARRTRAASARGSVSSGSIGGYPCGGALPPCYVLARESGGDPNAQNPSSSASGLWQILDSTWGGYGGYASAADAPPAVQNERAAQLAPCNWQPPNYCAGG